MGFCWGNLSSPYKWMLMEPYLKLAGGWTNPFEKYARQIGSCPQGSG